MFQSMKDQKKRRWHISTTTGEDLGYVEAESPTDAIERMLELGPRGRDAVSAALTMSNFQGLTDADLAKFPPPPKLEEASREFPLGFLQPSIPPTCGVPATPGEVEGTVPLTDPALYTIHGTLLNTTLLVGFDGSAPQLFTATFVDNMAVFLQHLNLFLNPIGGTALTDPITNFMILRSNTDGGGSSVTVSGGTMPPVVGITPGTYTGTPALPPTGAFPVISRPQMFFRGERLVVPASIAENFTLVDIKIGNRSQLANSTGLPATTFVEGSVGVRLALDFAETAQDVALIVENISSEAQTFIATLIGSTFLMV